MAGIFFSAGLTIAKGPVPAGDARGIRHTLIRETDGIAQTGRTVRGKEGLRGIKDLYIDGRIMLAAVGIHNC